LVAAAPLEQKFWESFRAAIGLEPEWWDDDRDPAGTAARVAAIIASQPSSHWRAVFAKADCCCCIVATVEEALADPHFRNRGLFDRVLRNENGATLPALPTPLAPSLRAGPHDAASPALGGRA
jgi:crotonobetainyl-CoA:carnitine CoA-transferase CaiB-like acyl-CoA transferase